jgi:hypothetical protein
LLASARRTLGIEAARFAWASSTPNDDSAAVSIATVVRKASSPRPDGPSCRAVMRTFASERAAATMLVAKVAAAADANARPCTRGSCLSIES